MEIIIENSHFNSNSNWKFKDQLYHWLKFIIQIQILIENYTVNCNTDWKL